MEINKDTYNRITKALSALSIVGTEQTIINVVKVSEGWVNESTKNVYTTLPKVKELKQKALDFYALFLIGKEMLHKKHPEFLSKAQDMIREIIAIEMRELGEPHKRKKPPPTFFIAKEPQMVKRTKSGSGSNGFDNKGLDKW